MTPSPNARIVLGFAGTAADVATVRALVAQGREVIAVIVDVGQASDVDHVREQALSAGASRAHVFDVREEFAHHYVSAARQMSSLHDLAVAVRTEPLVTRKLADVAAIERTTDVAGSTAFDAPADAPRGQHAARMLLERPVLDPAHAPETAAHVDLQIQGGVPVAINGVPLSVAELLESVALIAGRHGIGRLPQIDAPAAPIVHAAFSTLNGGDGIVRFQLHKGELSVLPAHDDNPLLVNHA